MPSKLALMNSHACARVSSRRSRVAAPPRSLRRSFGLWLSPSAFATRAGSFTLQSAPSRRPRDSAAVSVSRRAASRSKRASSPSSTATSSATAAREGSTAAGSKVSPFRFAYASPSRASSVRTSGSRPVSASAPITWGRASETTGSSPSLAAQPRASVAVDLVTVRPRPCFQITARGAGSVTRRLASPEKPGASGSSARQRVAESGTALWGRRSVGAGSSAPGSAGAGSAGAETGLGAARRPRGARRRRDSRASQRVRA